MTIFPSLRVAHATQQSNCLLHSFIQPYGSPRPSGPLDDVAGVSLRDGTTDVAIQKACHCEALKAVAIQSYPKPGCFPPHYVRGRKDILLIVLPAMPETSIRTTTVRSSFACHSNAQLTFADPTTSAGPPRKPTKPHIRKPLYDKDLLFLRIFPQHSEFYLIFTWHLPLLE